MVPERALRNLPDKHEAYLILHPLFLSIRRELCERFPQYAKRLQGTWMEIGPRMTQTLGSANWGLKRVKLSRLLAAPENAHRREETIRHELAHIAAPKTAGHNIYWRAIARQFGADGNRTTHCSEMGLLVKRRTMKRYLYKCSICGFEIEATGKRHANIQERGAIYRHKGCPGLLGRAQYIRRTE